MKKLLFLFFIIGFNLYANSVNIKPMLQMKPNFISDISVNSKFIVLSNITDNSIYLYEKSTNRLINTIHLNFRVVSVKLFNNSLYVGSKGGIYKINLYDLKTQKLNIPLNSNEIVGDIVTTKNFILCLIYEYNTQKSIPLKIVILKNDKLKNELSLTKQIGIDNLGNKIKFYTKYSLEDLILHHYDKLQNIAILVYKHNDKIWIIKNTPKKIIVKIIRENMKGVVGILGKTNGFKFSLKSKSFSLSDFYKDEIYFVSNNNLKRLNIYTKKEESILSGKSNNLSNIINKVSKLAYLGNTKITNGIFDYNMRLYSLYKKEKKEIEVTNDKDKLKIIFRDWKNHKWNIHAQTININSSNVLFARLSNKNNYLLISCFNRKNSISSLYLYNISRKKIIYKKTFPKNELIFSGIYLENKNKIIFTSIGKVNELNINNNFINSKQIEGINIVFYYKNLIILQEINSELRYKFSYFDENLNLKYSKIGFRSNKKFKHTFKYGKGNIITIKTGCRMSWSGTISKKIRNKLKEKYCDGIVITSNGYFFGSGEYKKYLHISDIKNLKTYDIDAFYDKFYRPDIVKKIMKGLKVRISDSIKNVITKNPAPQVEIIRVSNDISKDEKIKNTNSQYIFLTIKIKSNGGKIGKIQVFNNSIAVKDDNIRALKIFHKNMIKYKKYKIYLKRGKNHIEVYASNSDNSMKSKVASYDIKANINKTSDKNLYAVIVGIDKFKSSKNNLRYSVKDAKAFAKSLKKIASKIYKNVYITLLTTPQQTTKQNIKKILKKYRRIGKTEDTFVFYGASHGYVDELNGEYYFITSDFNGNFKNSLNRDEITRLLSNVKMGHKLIILDTCYSTEGSEDMLTDLVNPSLEKISKNGITIFAGSGTKQEALEGYKGHGVFTYTLLEAMKKGVNVGNNDNILSVSEVGSYVESQTPIYADKMNFIQTPLFEKRGENFLIGKK